MYPSKRTVYDSHGRANRMACRYDAPFSHVVSFISICNPSFRTCMLHYSLSYLSHSLLTKSRSRTSMSKGNHMHISNLWCPVCLENIYVNSRKKNISINFLHIRHFMHIFIIFGYHTEMICIWFPLGTPVLTLNSVQKCSVLTICNIEVSSGSPPPSPRLVEGRARGRGEPSSSESRDGGQDWLRLPRPPWATHLEASLSRGNCLAHVNEPWFQLLFARWRAKRCKDKSLSKIHISQDGVQYGV